MSRLPARAFAAAALIAAALSLGACAGTPASADAEFEAGPYDPLEGVNRPIFAFNKALDDYALKPAAKGYRTVLPEMVRDGVRNFLNNLRTPIILVNDALQGNGERAGKTFARFWMNTVLGLGGLIDVAGIHGIPFHDEDFGQTLAVWGVPEGPYLMLPVFGPSNPRDATGLGTEFVFDPVNRMLRGKDLDAAVYGRTVTNAVDARSRNIETFDKLESTSLDYYATIRSLYRQRRGSLIRNEDDAGPSSPLGLEPREAAPVAVVQ
jgi:phospholipid-binding lipoprotein MlaA